MKLFLGIIMPIFILLAVGCSQKKSVAKTEQLLQKSKPKLQKNDCWSKYGGYPRSYPSYNEFKRCEFK